MVIRQLLECTNKLKITVKIKIITILQSYCGVMVITLVLQTKKNYNNFINNITNYV